MKLSENDCIVPDYVPKVGDFATVAALFSEPRVFGHKVRTQRRVPVSIYIPKRYATEIQAAELALCRLGGGCSAYHLSGMWIGEDRLYKEPVTQIESGIPFGAAVRSVVLSKLAHVIARLLDVHGEETVLVSIGDEYHFIGGKDD